MPSCHIFIREHFHAGERGLRLSLNGINFDPLRTVSLTRCICYGKATVKESGKERKTSTYERVVEEWQEKGEK